MKWVNQKIKKAENPSSYKVKGTIFSFKYVQWEMDYFYEYTVMGITNCSSVYLISLGSILNFLPTT